MLTIRKGSDRGVTNFGWLDSRHSFSFGDYFDPAHHHFRSLRVINEDRVAGGGGFPTHPHRDMEIITYVLSGELQHRDSMGNGSVIRPGAWQKMSAGTGIQHSEFNASATETVHLLQIWIVPDRKGIAPNYSELTVGDDDARNRWKLVASPDGRDGTIVVHQDALLSVARLEGAASLDYPFAKGRGGWLQVVTGTATVGGTPLAAGDAVAIEDEEKVTVAGDGEVMLFDLA